MSGLDRDKEAAGEKKAAWKPAAAQKAEDIAKAAAGKYAQYAGSGDKAKAGGAGALRAEVFKKPAAGAFDSKSEIEFGAKDPKSLIAHELSHVVQQKESKPVSKPTYLKHPAPHEEPDSKQKVDKPAKQVIVVDRKKGLTAPADSETLAALADKMFEKFNAEAEQERDVTGAD
jgi:hypothetical protein